LLPTEVYIADHGIREAVSAVNARDINPILEISCIWSCCAEALHHRGQSRDKEIDFVCDKREKSSTCRLRICLASEETVAREFGAYDCIRDNFPKYVVSLDAI
jgi:predicted AAA+ superfamily ATPase